jgi:PAS domain S-box-containing protein
MKMGIRAKLTFMIGGCVVILVLATGIVTTMRERAVMERELRKRGLALASDLAKFSVRPLLGHDLATLRRFVIHSLDQEYVRYVMILDPNGRVVMHSDLSQVGKVYTDDLSVTALKSPVPGYTDVHAGAHEELHCDIYVPIQVGDFALGTVRLGYSHLAIEKEIVAARQEVLILGLFTAVVGGVAAYLLATFIALPIKRITSAIGKVAGGNLNTRLEIRRSDEIGTLADAFNRMTGELDKTTVSKDYFNNIIESINDALVVVGPDGKIRSVNWKTGEILGYEEKDLVGMEMHGLVPQGERIFDFPDFLTQVKGSNVGNREVDFLTKSGKRVPMLLSAAVLRNKEGESEEAVCIARDITVRKEVEEALRQSERDLHHLSSQLIRAQEDERRRLSIKLHDELGQALIVLKLQLSSIRQGLRADQDELKMECDEMLGYIKQVTESVRRLSRDLSPAILDDLVLSAALRHLVDNFRKYSGLDCSVELMADLDHIFSRDEEITVYRIIQECLTNVVKHAEATHVSLVISDDGRSISFRIEDNGKGFNLNRASHWDADRTGLGLVAMSERVRMLGGFLEIHGQEGEGTRIIFSVPIHYAGDEE